MVDVVVVAGDLLIRAVLRLLGFATRRQLQLIGDVLPCLALVGHSQVAFFDEFLIWIVLCIGVLGEVLFVLLGNRHVEVLEVVEARLCEQLELLTPNDCHTHVFASVRHNGTGQQVWVHSHEALLVQAEVSEELSVLLEMLCQFGRRLV